MTEQSGRGPWKFMTQWRHISVIDQEIRRGRYPSAPSLARKLELSARTIKRHIAFMRWDLGAPIEYDASKKGYYYSEDDWLLPAIKVSEGELFAVVLAERALRGLRNGPLADKVRRVFNKIALQLPEEIELDPATLADGISFESGAVMPADPEVFGTLSAALKNDKTVKLKYYKLGADRMVDRTVDPYELRSIRGEWYLVGPSRESGYVSLFNVGRIREIKETGDTFNRDEIDFDADEYFEHSLGASHSKEGKKVKIRFTGWAARYISEREWHPTQKLEETEDGSVELTMKLGWLEEVCSWVLSFGPNAEALEPEELREMVAERLQTTLDIY